MSDIENNIFKRYKVNVDKLICYGFKLVDNNYFYSKNILNNTFRVDININKDNDINGKIIDLNFNEEYVNFKLSNNSYASMVRNEYEKFLLDIRNNCFEEELFLSSQANRIAKYIIGKYKDKPEFMWEKFPFYGVFRNKDNNKWYAIIMNINKNKIDNKTNREVEIIDIRISKDMIGDILKQDGFYPAWHMNKNRWVSICLDDTLSDEEIIKYVDESYDLIKS